MIFDIAHKPEFHAQIEFNTTIAKKVKGNEQRHCRWINPKRVFDLKFANSPENTAALEAFFVGQKGNYELFYWHCGLLGLDFKCFFEGDKLAQKMLDMGYSDTALSLVCIDDGNVLKNRFLTSTKDWGIDGNVVIADEKVTLVDDSFIEQKNVLKAGQAYVLEVFCEEIFGDVPLISANTSNGDIATRSLSSGVNEINFIAASEDFRVEQKLGSYCVLKDFALYEKYTHIPRLEIPARVERTKEVIFNTFSDEKFTYQNNRRAMWDVPLRRFELEFLLNPEQTLEFMRFFISQKGRYKSFLWSDGASDYQVRFDDDVLDMDIFDLGYSQCKIPLIEVRS